MSRRVEIYGEISTRDSISETIITAQNVWTKFIGWDTVGIQRNFEGSLTEDETLVKFDTKCLCTVSLNFTFNSGGSNARTIEFEVRANDTKVFDNLAAKRYLSAGGKDIASVSISGLVQFLGGDEIQLWVRNLTDSSNIIITNATMSAIRID